MRIAYQGVACAHSHLAAMTLHPDSQAVGFGDFGGLVKAVADGRADVGLLPVHNTIVGEVPGALGALELWPDVEVIQTIERRISHCLLALPGADLDSIRWVESHPVALAQCARWLSARRLAPRNAEDTAGAARAIAAERDWTRAAIASQEAAERYGLVVVARDIADTTDNYTRFAVLARRAAHREVAA